MKSAVETRYSVQKMMCDGCITKARETLSKLPGFVDADFDLKTSVAIVRGDVDPEAVAKALTDAGYPAVVETNE